MSQPPSQTPSWRVRYGEPPTILFEDNHLLAIAKPAGLATMGVEAEEPSAYTWAKEYLREKYQKPGNVYVGIVSRLDALATGVLLLARTSKAAARLTAAFAGGEVEKVYWAVVAGAPNPAAGECTDWVAKSERQRRMLVVSQREPGAQIARLSYRTLSRHRLATRGGKEIAASLLEVLLDTGRKHQIRLQLASRGWPVLGDDKYGSGETPAATRPSDCGGAVMLHCRRLRLTHPVRQTPLELIAPLPPVWREFGIREEGK